MSTIGQVHWHEGLFLQPHHLQTMQRDNVEAGSRERRLTWAFPYGVVDLRLSTDALENMLVRIDRLRAVMPSGLEIDVPGNSDIPALDIKRVFQAGSDASKSVDTVHDCACSAGVSKSADRQSASGHEARARRKTIRLLLAASGRRSTVENGDVSLPLDAGTE